MTCETCHGEGGWHRKYGNHIYNALKKQLFSQPQQSE